LIGCDDVDEQPVFLLRFAAKAQRRVRKDVIQFLLPTAPAQALYRLRKSLVVDQEVDILGLAFRRVRTRGDAANDHRGNVTAKRLRPYRGVLSRQSHEPLQVAAGAASLFAKAAIQVEAAPA